MSKLLINQYYKELTKIKQRGNNRNESSISIPFYNLLNQYCIPKGFSLIFQLTNQDKKIRPDGTIKDDLGLDWGYWESKDEDDNLDKEIENKFAKGYPNDNILFEDSHTAVLIQAGREIMRVTMTDSGALDRILKQFIEYQRPEVAEFYQAIEKFKEDLPTIIITLREKIDQASENNQNFITKRDNFLKVCKESINPNITPEDIREMMIQHILTEDIFLTIFDEAQFHRNNNIARELTELINTFLKGAARKQLLSTIQHYYVVIKRKASQINNHHDKQQFLKSVYENFYKAYNPKAADRLGIVYTPNEIVKFMVESVDHLCYQHFGKFLEDKGVKILDPATGTGTFITEIIEYLNPDKLKYKYQNEIHCHEVSILPYYIANLNIEATYFQKMGEYVEFKNISFVDTLDYTAFHLKQMDVSAISVENTARSFRQNDLEISVIIGNPPYNAKQENYNQNNANFPYQDVDDRIKATYIKQGKAQNQIVLYDLYVRFFRWASDRLNKNGIIAFITNNSFIDALTFDGFRKVLADEFSHIYIIDLGGNIRKGDQTGNVFNIMVGVAISFLVKKTNTNSIHCQIFYYKLLENTGQEKLNFLNQNHFKQINFTHIIPDKKQNWIDQSDNDFDDLLPLINKDVKAGKSEKAVFKLFSSGLKTQRDEWVYDFCQDNLIQKVQVLIKIYQQTLEDKDFEGKNQIKWDRELTKYLDRRIKKEFDVNQIVKSLYRPYIQQYFYFDQHFNGMTYQWYNIYNQDDNDNKIITIPGLSSPKDFFCLTSKYIVDLNCLPAGSQCLPLYTYDKNGNRKENITDWGLQQFREYYRRDLIPLNPQQFDSQTLKSQASKLQGLNYDNDQDGLTVLNPYEITKEDIFYYVYAVLHNPEYRKKYELNLKREFPRIPFYDDFFKWVRWGKRLMELHLNYESVDPYPLTVIARRKTNTNKSTTPNSDLAEAISNPGEIASLRLTSCAGGLDDHNQNLSPQNSPRNDNNEINSAPMSGNLGDLKPKLKADKIKGEIILDDATILTGIPGISWEYKLGNRCALEWILDQYKEKKPKDPTIAERFNTYRFALYKEKVIDLLMRVTTVSVETMKIIKEMEELTGNS